MSKVRLAITMGDPAGIGPEIILKALKNLPEHFGAELIIVGTARCFIDVAQLMGDEETAERLLAAQADEPVRFIEATRARHAITLGRCSAEAGRLAYSAVKAAIELALQGEVDAIVTAPINKEALHQAGCPYPGHTEMLTSLTGSEASCMMLVHQHLRVSHLTTHTALAKVPELLSEGRLEQVIRLTHEAVVQLGVSQPCIAVAALNPHAGEEGLFGDEDLRITQPTVARLQSQGFDVTGPVAGDTVFVKAWAGQFDAVIAMYHDQGHIPVKLLGFAVDSESGRWQSVSGVNVTLGLPIIRTSVDHGTAFDIAGQGIANEGSLLDAIFLARQLVVAEE